MRLVRRASIKTGDLGHPVRTDTGLVLSGAGVAHFDARTFRQDWRADIQLSVHVCVNGVLLGRETFGELLQFVTADDRSSLAPLALTALDGGDGAVLWRRPMDIGAACVLNDQVLLSPPSSEEFHYLDLRTGCTLRTVPTRFRRYAGASSGISLFGGAASIMGGPADPFAAVDSRTMKPLWEAHLLDQPCCDDAPGSRASILAVTDGRILLQNGNHLTSLELETGTRCWHSVVPEGYEPYHCALGYVVGAGQGLAVVDVRTGAVRLVPGWRALRSAPLWVIGTYKRWVVCAYAGSTVVLLDPRRGALQQLPAPRHAADEAMELHGLLCLVEGGRLLLADVVKATPRVRGRPRALPSGAAPSRRRG